MKRSIKIAWAILLIISCAALLASCSTTRKTKYVTKSTVDSSSVTRVDSNTVKTDETAAVKKDNSVTTVEKEDNYTKETVIEFREDLLTKEKIDSAIASGKPFTTGWITATDYFPPVRKITIKETGVKKEKQTIAANTVDSSTGSKKETVDLTKAVNTDLHKTSTEKNKEVKRTSYWAYLWFLLIPAVWIVGWYFGLWPLIPKRKKKQ